MTEDMKEFLEDYAVKEHEHYVDSGLMTEKQYLRYKRNPTIFFDYSDDSMFILCDEQGNPVNPSIKGQIDRHDKHILCLEREIREAKKITRNLIKMRKAIKEMCFDGVGAEELLHLYEHPEVHVDLPHIGIDALLYDDGIARRTLSMHIRRAEEQKSKLERARKDAFREEIMRRLREYKP